MPPLCYLLFVQRNTSRFPHLKNITSILPIQSRFWQMLVKKIYLLSFVLMSGYGKLEIPNLSTNLDLRNNRAFQNCSTEIRTIKIRLIQIGISQICTFQVCFTEISAG